MKSLSCMEVHEEGLQLSAAGVGWISQGFEGLAG